MILEIPKPLPPPPVMDDVIINGKLVGYVLGVSELKKVWRVIVGV